MGLDIVELILAVEDGFRIHIPDEEASEVSTVGDLYEVVLAKLHNQDSKRCLTSAAFYRTRRALIGTLGLDRRQVRPSTPLVAILPESARRENWRRIQDAMELKLPELEHSGLSISALVALGVALAVGTGLYVRAGPVGLALLFFLGLVIGGFLVQFSPSLAVAFPRRELTVGDLVRDVVALNHGRLAAETGSWNRSEVWEALCRAIVAQTGIERKAITPEARIVDDLGMD